MGQSLWLVPLEYDTVEFEWKKKKKKEKCGRTVVVSPSAQ